jgi:hypothetical protein
MIIGCLTDTAKCPGVAGSYSYHVPGLHAPLPPDLHPEPVAVEQDGDRSGPFSFSVGALTRANREPHRGVAWSAAAVGDTGVDVVVVLGRTYFVDRVILRQPSPQRAGTRHAPILQPGADNIEAAGHVEPDGLSCVEVFASSSTAGEEALVGRVGQRGPEILAPSPITVHVGVEATHLVVRLISFRRDICLDGLEIWGADPSEPEVFPVPAQRLRLPSLPFVLGPGSTIQLGEAASEDERFAATLLAEKIKESYGWAFPIAVRPELEAGTLLIGRPEGPANLLSRRKPILDQPESYALQVDVKGGALLANDRRGWVYGVETLLQLVASGTWQGDALSIKPCRIKDAPRLPFRGAHLFLPSRDQIAYTKRLIRYLLAPMKLNTLFLELAGGMCFDRRPEICETWARNNLLAAEGLAPPVPHGAVGGGSWLTKAEVKDLVDYARSYGIEVIPEIQSLSHVQYLTMTYPEIAEQSIEGGYPDSYCPLHPKSHEIVFDMIDEVIDLLGPLRYLHMGHDEVYTMAACPRCAGKTRDELYAHDVKAIYDYLKAKGVGMMVWADMLQPWQRYACQDAAPLIPKDIVMLEFVWYFRPWADTEDILLENGFQVIFGNCYSSHFTRYQDRTSKEGVIGAQVSVWAATDEETMGRLGKLYDLIYSANRAWSSTCQDELRWTFDRRIAQLLPGIRARLSGQGSASHPRAGNATPLDLGAHWTAPHRDVAGGRGGYDLSTLPRGKTTLRGRPFHLGEGVILVESPGSRARVAPACVTVPVPARARSLVFAHCCTCRAPITQAIGSRPAIARYRVEYVDGTAEVIDVAYGHHVAEWNRRHGAPLGARFYRHAGYVATYPVDPLWQGKTARGEDVTLYGLEWFNPQPEVELRCVHIESVESSSDAALIVAGITLVREEG